LPDDKPIKVTVELPTQVHRDLVAYGKVLKPQTGQIIADPAKLIVPMVERFMALQSCDAHKQVRTQRRKGPINANDTLFYRVFDKSDAFRKTAALHRKS
jgi:hypothetical protein